MVKHVILWQLKDSFTEEEKTEIKAGIKAGLEGLAGQIPGLLSIQVHTEGLPSSNADLMLDSCFADAASLKGYSVHPAHVAVADGRSLLHISGPTRLGMVSYAVLCFEKKKTYS